MMSEQTLKLAAQIAELLDAGEDDKTRRMHQALEKITRRLDAIEGKLRSDKSTPQLRINKVNHPSLGTFSVSEAIVDGLFGGPDAEKACRFEPTGKPCDHCSMCSSLGF